MSISQQPSESEIQPIAFIAQLRQQALKMRHIDEIFAWMSGAMVYQWQIPVVQFWAPQAYATGQFRLELRVSTSRDPSLPATVHANQQIADVIKRLLQEKRGIAPLPIASVFPPSQVAALAHYGLHYWAGYFTSKELWLPPRQDATAEKIATPLTMMIALFLQQPPAERLGRAVDFIFQHSLPLAAELGLVTPSQSPAPQNIPSGVFPQQAQLDLSALIPHRSESIEEIKTGNPFANATVLPDKKTRQLYSLINDQRDVATLARLTGLDQKEVEEAIRLLLERGKIQLYDLEGKHIETSPFLKPS